MATVLEIAAHSVDHMFSFVFRLFVIVISHSGFEGWIWVLIVSVPGICILLIFTYLTAPQLSHLKQIATIKIYPQPPSVSWITIKFVCCCCFY